LIITLLTDFGTADGYVAEMRGVLMTAVPGVSVVDLSHDIPPHDVEAARLAVARFWRRFPAGTIHMVVVDPGVGAARLALGVESDDLSRARRLCPGRRGAGRGPDTRVVRCAAC
jgi:S-adenosylmethionine hydrolase